MDDRALLTAYERIDDEADRLTLVLHRDDIAELAVAASGEGHDIAGAGILVPHLGRRLRLRLAVHDEGRERRLAAGEGVVS